MGRMAMITAAADGWAVAQSASAGVIEVVLHDGISSGQAESAAECKMVMQFGGHSWRDHAMAGGAGRSAGARRCRNGPCWPTYPMAATNSPARTLPRPQERPFAARRGPWHGPEGHHQELSPANPGMTTWSALLTP